MSEENINKLQLIEQQLSQTHSQKQGYAQYIHDIDSALKELDAVDSAYKIVGTVMLEKSSADIKTDLTEKKESYSVRLQALEKQESRLQEQAKELQSQVMDSLQSKTK